MTFSIIASVLGLIGVFAGVLGSHAVSMNPEISRVFGIAQTFLFFHVPVVLFTGYLASKNLSNLFRYASVIFLSGIILFSGNLYLYCFTGILLFRKFTPMGGMLLMVGWITLAYSFIKLKGMNGKI